MQMTETITLRTGQGDGLPYLFVATSEAEMTAAGFEPVVVSRIAPRLGNEDFLAVASVAPVPVWVGGVKTESDSMYRLQGHRALGAKCRGGLNGEKVAEAAVRFAPSIGKEEALALIEGIVLSHYQFLRYRTGDRAKPNALKTLHVSGGNLSQSDLDALTRLCQAVCHARDLVNEPVLTLTATAMGQRAVELGRWAGFDVNVIDRAGIEALGMGGLLGVNRGSVEPPVFIVMEYRPKAPRNEKPVVLVGKGVVYDTGGYNIKTDGHMSTMKCDMGGGAAVIGTLTALALAKSDLHVVGLVPTTDNRIDGKALVADDVITMMDGTTVEIQNTDAEGRLILADALHYAKRYEPQLVIDLATLTGAAAAITGFHGIVAVGSAPEQLIRLVASGERVYERIMPLPMWREHDDMLRSDIADMRNIGGPVAGAITAGAFLRRFTDYPWIHLDIAGPAFMKDDVDYRLKGGTGVGVRLLSDFLSSI
jgi:leucyl aminopeptidase